MLVFLDRHSKGISHATSNPFNSWLTWILRSKIRIKRGQIHSFIRFCLRCHSRLMASTFISSVPVALQNASIISTWAYCSPVCSRAYSLLNSSTARQNASRSSRWTTFACCIPKHVSPVHGRTMPSSDTAFLGHAIGMYWRSVSRSTPYSALIAPGSTATPAYKALYHVALIELPGVPWWGMWSSTGIIIASPMPSTSYTDSTF